MIQFSKNLLVRLTLFVAFTGGSIMGHAQTPAPTPTPAPTRGIAFEHIHFADLCAKAKAANKLIFIDFYTTWCGPCKYMATNLFTKDSVGAYFNDHFINIKVDAEKEEWRGLAAKYFVKSYPTLLFMDHNGAVFFKGSSTISDSVLLGWAARAVQEFTDPGSLPRLQAEFQAKKQDTAFLLTYLKKLKESDIRSTRILEQYLAVQKAIPEGSRAMLGFLLENREEWAYGGKTEAILAKYNDQYLKMCDSAMLAHLKWGKNFIIFRTRDYAKEEKSERLLNVYLAKARRRNLDDYYTNYAKVWLDYYASTDNWIKYQSKADKWLDSICGLLKPDPNPERAVDYTVPFTPQELRVRWLAEIVSQNAMIYLSQFRSQDGVQDKAFRWMTKATSADPMNANALSLYANMVYQHQDTARAVHLKRRALEIMPGGLHTLIVQTNLDHMLKGELLEEED